MEKNDGSRWVGTWSTSLAPVDGIELDDQTVRMVARVSIGGRRLRVRLSNACGTRKLSIGSIGGWLVSGVEVLAPANTGGIVAFGDSLTECNVSTVDANRRWPDQLARRIVARAAGCSA